MTADRDAVAQQLRDRVDRFMAGDPGALSGDDTASLAVRLGTMAKPGADGFVDLLQLLGWVYLGRNGILNPGARLPDAGSTFRMLAPVHQSAPQTLPTSLLVTVEAVAGLSPYREPERLVGKGLNLMDHGLAKQDVPSVVRAINLFLDAADAATPDHPDRAAMLTNACSGWLSVYELIRDPSAIDQAVRIGEQAVAALLPDDEHVAEPLNNLGVALRLRFGRDGEQADLDRAIELLADGVRHTAPDHVDLAVRYNNLGIAHGLRHQLTGRPADLDQAITALRQAAERIAPHRGQRPGFLGDLGYFLWVRFERTADRADLAEAADMLAVAVTSHDPDLRQRAQAYLDAAREKLAERPERRRWWRS